MKGIHSLKIALDERQVKKTSIERNIEGLEICPDSSNSKFDQDHLLQKNGTTTGAPNSCYFYDLVIYKPDKLNRMNKLVTLISYFHLY